MDCFLFESSALPRINTFIVLDIVIKMLKGKKNEIKSKEKKKKSKTVTKALYLTNRMLTEAFPPDYHFIINFLASSMTEKKDSRTSLNGKYNWVIKKVKDYKKGINEDINYFNLKMNNRVTTEELKEILKDIHIKYIDKDMCLIKILYKLNEYKKYDLIVINLAFFFVKDEKKINIFIDTFFLSANCIDNGQEITKTSLNNTKEEPPSYATNKKNMLNSQMEREICDTIFYKNILNLSFHYSFFINFFDYLNRFDLSTTNYKLYKHTNNEWDKYHIKHGSENIKDNDKGGYTLIANEELKSNNSVYHFEDFLNKNEKINGGRKRSYTKNILTKKIEKKFKKEKKSFFKEEEKLGMNEKREYNNSVAIATAAVSNKINCEDVKFDNFLVDSRFCNFSKDKINSSNAENGTYNKHILRNESTIFANNPYTHLTCSDNKPLKGDTSNSLEQTEKTKKKKKKKRTKNNLCMFDIIPKSDTYKKMYMNIISVNFNYAYLIS
ncbi:conserved Plasmodium protein, unknown function [Plasmodium malariae]|uniref:Uncharacterized protein n=1 Tax=Plasmodium malariae TaxID=5858 RepID=A0A1C3KCU2_PLAMA|nr:conserved Plasmodium protein, unknown function [Plasmodium malariae]